MTVMKKYDKLYMFIPYGTNSAIPKGACINGVPAGYTLTNKVLPSERVWRKQVLQY